MKIELLQIFFISFRKFSGFFFVFYYGGEEVEQTPQQLVILLEKMGDLSENLIHQHAQPLYEYLKNEAPDRLLPLPAKIYLGNSTDAVSSGGRGVSIGEERGVERGRKKRRAIA